jgi:TonB family protein
MGVGSRGPLADPTLVTKLEIVLNADGTIAEVGVVHASGQILFDHGAWAAVYAGQPYPAAPDAIRSGDGRVYLRWTFKSIEPYCHVIQAERYILDNAPGSAAPAGSPAHDRASLLPSLPGATPPPPGGR